MDNLPEFKNAYESALQRELLKELFSNDFIKNHFFLTGGTALSVFYAGHRRSKDLDLFLLKKINLLEYVRVFRNVSSLWSVVSENSEFCSYIFEGGIKVDFVYDRFSCGGPISRSIVDGVKINIDILKNITINKICAVVSRTEPKDIIDMAWIFSSIFNVKKDFLDLFLEATRREGLLEDILFVKGVFNYISISAEKFVDIIKPSMLVNISSNEISTIFGEFERIIEGLIK